MLQTSHLQELKQRYASMYIQQEDTEEVEVSEGIRDFKLGDAVKFVNDDSDFLGQTGKITSLSGNGISQKATVKLDKGGKSVTNVLVKVDLIKEEVAEGWKKGKYTIKDENGKILGTYSSGGKAKKVMDDLMQKGDYPELTVSMVEEVEIAESIHDKKSTFTMAPFEDLRGVADVALKIMQRQPQEVKEEEQEVTSEETPQQLTE
jgi:hypothetical protein